MGRPVHNLKRAGSTPPCSLSVTARSASGGHSARCSPTHAPALLGAQGGQRDQRPADLRPNRQHDGCSPRSATAEDRDHAVGAINVFAHEFGAKWPKAVAKIVDDTEPCSPSTTSRPSTGSTSRPPTRSSRHSRRCAYETKVTKGPGSKAAGLAMAFKLIESAEHRWRAVNGPHLVALVRAGTRFDKGVIVERQQHDQEDAA